MTKNALLVTLLMMASGVMINGGYGQTTSTGSGQGFPVKPIRIVTAEAGGGNDFAVRLIAPGASSGLGQQIIVDNRGPGIIPSETVVKAPPDGYTLLLHGSSIWLSSFLQDNVPYDPLRDLAPITIVPGRRMCCPCILRCP